MNSVFWPMNPRKPHPDVMFLDAAYFAGIKGPGGRWLVRPGQWHTGVDLNGPNGNDTDFDQDVHCPCAGTVVFAGEGKGAWGNLVVVWCPDVKRWMRFAHLNRVLVTVGQNIVPGKRIGTVGKGKNGVYAAHLHWDVLKKKPASWSDWPGNNLSRVLEFYEDPMKFMSRQDKLFEPPRWVGDDA